MGENIFSSSFFIYQNSLLTVYQEEISGSIVSILEDTSPFIEETPKEMVSVVDRIDCHKFTIKI